jgi:hypothetical protein
MNTQPLTDERLIEYKKLKESDLFTFFKFSEIGRRRGEKGLAMVNFKPGGFQEFIDIAMQMDVSGRIYSALLMMDRKWIGNEKTINSFGKDLAKSFIQQMTPESDREEIEPVVFILWDMIGQEDQVIGIRPIEAVSTPEMQGIATVVDVYKGIKKTFTYQMSESTMKIENVVDGGRDRLKITISSKTLEENYN